MLEETGSEVDKFFLSGYPSFEYNRLASPKQQFLRLQRSPSWNLHGVEWRASARESFKKAYAEDFNRNIDKFFAPYHDFDYNPRGEAKAELWRLRNRKEWHFPKDEENWRPSDVKRNREYVIAREGFFAAFIADFHCFFGVGDDVQDWVFLCDVLRVRPAPPTVEECRAVILSPIVQGSELSLMEARIGPRAVPCQYIQPPRSRTAKSPTHLTPRSRGSQGIYGRKTLEVPVGTCTGYLYGIFTTKT